MVEIPALAISSTDCRDAQAPRRAGLVPRARRRRPVHRQARPLPVPDPRSRTSLDRHRLRRRARPRPPRARLRQARQQIVAFDVSEQLAITDAFLIASGSNDRQVKAIVDEVEDKLREHGAKPIRREGGRDGRWVLIDYGEW